MKIEIKDRYTGWIISSGDFLSVKDCLEKNHCANLRYADLSGANLSYADLSGANLSYADLSGTDLRRADLRYADLRSANLSGANLCGVNLCGVNLCGANLCGANLIWSNLRCADLSYADLCGADLCGADLRYADLRSAILNDIKNYYNSLEVFWEIVHSQGQEQNFFTSAEWAIIGKIAIHKFCWGEIIELGRPVSTICQKISKLGWDEYEKEIKKRVTGGKE